MASRAAMVLLATVCASCSTSTVGPSSTVSDSRLGVRFEEPQGWLRNGNVAAVATRAYAPAADSPVVLALSRFDLEHLAGANAVAGGETWLAHRVGEGYLARLHNELDFHVLEVSLHRLRRIDSAPAIDIVVSYPSKQAKRFEVHSTLIIRESAVTVVQFQAPQGTVFDEHLPVFQRLVDSIRRL